jgi:hypothetical protein
MAITNSVALVRERTIPTERPLLVGEVSADPYGRILGFLDRIKGIALLFTFTHSRKISFGFAH